MGVSQSAYYTWIKRLGHPDQDQERMNLVKEAYEHSRRTYGYRRIQIWIKREYDLQINHKTVLRLMNKLNIQSIARRKNPYRQIQNHYGSIHTYPNILKQDFNTSMSRKGNCLDSAPTESFFSQLKGELLRHIKIQDLNEAIQLVDDYIHFYNNDRIQLKTKLTPVEFRCQFV